MGDSTSCEGNSVNHCTRSSFKVTRLSTFEESEMLGSVPCWVSVPGGYSANSHICIQVSIFSSQPSTMQGSRLRCSDRATDVFAAVMRETATSWRQRFNCLLVLKKDRQMMVQARRNKQRERASCLPASQAYCSMFKEATGSLQSLQSLSGQ